MIVIPTLTPVSAQTQINLSSIWIMASNSMSPNLNNNDGVIVNSSVPFNSLKLGDIIAFKTNSTDPDTGKQETIIHRVAQIVNDPDNGQRIIRAKGDANPGSIPSLDYPIFQQNYIGKVIYIIPQLGSALKHINTAEMGKSTTLAKAQGL
jgi:signal peptidase I